MKEPTCTIWLQGGDKVVVPGKLKDVQAKLGRGGFVEFKDAWDKPVSVNVANVTKVEAVPGSGA